MKDKTQTKKYKEIKEYIDLFISTLDNNEKDEYYYETDQELNEYVLKYRFLNWLKKYLNKKEVKKFTR